MILMLGLFADFHYVNHQSINEVESSTEKCIVFSFDSSGWLYVYHFGVAAYIQKYLKKDLDKRIAYSGSSGGALVATVLACERSAIDMYENVLTYREMCKWNIRNMVF